MAYLQGFGPEGDHLRSRFATQWKSANGYTDAEMEARVQWPNKNLAPPEEVEWVRFGVRHSGADRMNPGPDPVRRHDGTVVIEVFVPADQGDGALDDLCDAAAGIFRDYTGQQGLRMGSPYVVEVGRDGGWYKKNVLIPFVRDTVFS